MNIVKDTPANGKKKRRVIVELEPGETLQAFNDDKMYQLGDPMGDILPGYIINNTWPAYWCPIAQKWEV